MVQCSFLEANQTYVPYVLKTYYPHIIDIKSIIMPSLVTTSFWYEHKEYIKQKEYEFQNLLKVLELKKIALILTLGYFFVIVIFWYLFKKDNLGYQLLSKRSIETTQVSYRYLKEFDDSTALDINNNIPIETGVDSLSLPFLLLIGFIFPIVILSNWGTIKIFYSQYASITSLLEYCLIIVFIVVDLILFYIFFESILPPLFLLIGLYGASQKFRAGYYLFLYTLKVSLGNSYLCLRAKFRGSPKALVTKIMKETSWLAWLMPQGMVISLEM